MQSAFQTFSLDETGGAHLQIWTRFTQTGETVPYFCPFYLDSAEQTEL